MIRTGDKGAVEKVKAMKVSGDGYAYYIIMGTPPTEQKFRLQDREIYDSVKLQIREGKNTILINSFITADGGMKDDPLVIHIEKYAYVTTDCIRIGNMIIPTESRIVDANGKKLI